MRAPIVLVLGMHRSGTSVVAGLLHHSGVRMGSPATFYPRPNPENPRGFFEDARFRVLNDRLLGAQGYKVKGWATEIPEVAAGRGMRLAMASLLRTADRGSGAWGWKDPRQLLTMTPWLDAIEGVGLLPRVRIVWVERDPASIARSLVNRASVTTIDQGVAVVRAYRETCRCALDPLDLPSANVHFESLVDDPMAALASVGEMLGVEFSEHLVTGFVEPGLNRSGRGGGKA